MSVTRCPYCNKVIDPYDDWYDQGQLEDFTFKCSECGKEISASAECDVEFYLEETED